MRIALTLAVAAVVLGASVGQAQPQPPASSLQPPTSRTNAPWLGTWRLAMPSPADNPDPPFSRVTVRIEPAPEGLAVIYDAVRTRGGVAHLEWTGALDGVDRPLEGLDEAVTNAYQRVDDRSYDVAQKADGQLTTTTRVSISPDGRTMTTVTRGRDGRTQSATYTRVGGEGR